MGGLTLAFTTGNSFEYSRRIEEPLGVKNVPGLELIIISENGLICRSFRRGDLWREKPTEKYHREVSSFVARLSNIRELDGAYYSQGNELRTTLKPTANTFSSGELRLLERLHQDLLDPQEVRVYAHPFYLDLDPVRVMQESHSRAFGGKYEATKRLASETGHGLVLAIGDSASDLPMFEATHEAGGVNFLVANHNIDPPPENCQILSNSYTNGVNEVLAAVLKGIEVEAPG
jgi:hydroxymethylpyrimidine pyrophosphatase-like HAD family hydrolase